MGRTAAIRKNHFKAVTQKKIQRSNRVEYIKKQRKNLTSGTRKNQKVELRHHSVKLNLSDQKLELIYQQIGTAARIPQASRDLISILNRDIEIPSSFTFTYKDFLIRAVHEFMQVLPSLVLDEYGSSCVEKLIIQLYRYIKENDSEKSELKIESFIETVLNLDSAEYREKTKEFLLKTYEVDAQDEDYLLSTYAPQLDLLSLAQHMYSRRIIWSIIEYGTSSQIRYIVNKISNEVSSLAFHRHGSILIQKLLKQKGKIALFLEKELIPIISQLIQDRVGFKIALSLINDRTKLTIVNQLSNDSKFSLILVQTNRGTRFLIQLLMLDTFEDSCKKESDNTIIPVNISEVISNASTDVLADLRKVTELIAEPLIPEFFNMASSTTLNFLLQAILIAASASNCVPIQKAILDAIKEDIIYLSRHEIGIHVIQAVLNYGSELLQNSVTKKLCSQIKLIMNDQYGTLAIRALLSSKKASSIIDALEPYLMELLFDMNGNLIIQCMLRSSTPSYRSKFIQKFILKDIVNLCQHKYASHVIYDLLDLIEPNQFNAICVKLSDYYVDMAHHISARFIVEKLSKLNPTTRSTLLKSFHQLIYSKGTQGVLLQVYSSSTDNERTSLIESFIMPNIKEIATRKESSIVLQKLIGFEKSQENPILIPILKEKMSDASFHNYLLGDFFGRFIIELIKSFK